MGLSISSVEIAQIFNKTKAPYNISTPCAQLAKEALNVQGISKMQENVAKLNENRGLLVKSLKTLGFVGKFLGSLDANFVLVQIVNDKGVACNEKSFAIYKQLAESKGIVVRFRGNEKWCNGCLRITVGSEQEINCLMSEIKSLKL